MEASAAKKRSVSQVFKEFLAVAKPFWVAKGERLGAWGLLGIIVFLSLLLVALEVRINYWRNDFFDCFQDMNKAGFMKQLGVFGVLAALWIAATVYLAYLTQVLRMKWRRWLTERWLDAWIVKKAFYRMQACGDAADNPDQRIAVDLDLLCEKTLSLSLGLLSSVVSLLSFMTILWALSGAFSFAVFGVKISLPGYMLWLALVYAAAGSFIAHRIGRSLSKLRFEQQLREADFRFSLVRLRESSEQAALLRGEKAERENLLARFDKVVGNWLAILKRQKSLGWFSSFYGQAAIIFPYLAAAPRYFAGEIKLGGLMQTASAFNQVQSSLSWFIDSYTKLAEFKASIDRLSVFREHVEAAIEDSLSDKGVKFVRSESCAGFAVEDLDVKLPDGRLLIDKANIEFKPGTSTLICGPSGSGKTTFLRSLAGIWPFAEGKVVLPAGSEALFLPQKPYLTLGSFKAQLCYPSSPAEFDDALLRETARACGLAAFESRFDEEANWAQILSLGEQQRVAFARALLQKPAWLFMDEASSALDEASEDALLKLLREKLPSSAFISAGHRSSLEKLHSARVEIASGRLQAWSQGV